MDAGLSGTSRQLSVAPISSSCGCPRLVASLGSIMIANAYSLCILLESRTGPDIGSERGLQRGACDLLLFWPRLDGVLIAFGGEGDGYTCACTWAVVYCSREHRKRGNHGRRATWRTFPFWIGKARLPKREVCGVCCASACQSRASRNFVPSTAMGVLSFLSSDPSCERGGDVRLHAPRGSYRLGLSPCQSHRPCLHQRIPNATRSVWYRYGKYRTW